MRSFAAGLFILLGALLTFPASIAMWEQRVLTDRDAFVKVGQEAFRQQAVQDRLTEQIAEEVAAVAEANDINLPTSGISGVIAQNQVEALTRVVVSQLPESVIGRQVLVVSHKAVLTVIDNDRDRLTASNDEVRVNIRPAIEQVIAAFEPVVPALADIELPEGTGEIVIVEERDASIAFRAVRWFDGAAWFIALLPLAGFLIALAIAPNRPVALILIGMTLIATAGLRILLYEGPLKTLVTDGVTDNRPELAPAAASIYDAIAGSIVAQDMLLVAAGAGLLALGAVWWGLRRAAGV